MPRADIALVNTGRWTKVERRRYWHTSGAEITYRPNQWGWVASTHPHLLWPSLTAAAEAVERATT